MDEESRQSGQVHGMDATMMHSIDIDTATWLLIAIALLAIVILEVTR